MPKGFSFSMGPKYNVAASREELGRTTTCRRRKRHSKRAKARNLAKAAQKEPFAPLKRRQGTSIPSIHAQRLFIFHGAQIQCGSKQRRIGPHHNMQEEQTSF